MQETDRARGGARIGRADRARGRRQGHRGHRRRPGIVFHVSRCGSTLVSQLLKQHVGVVVYAEPLPVNEILLPPHKWPRPSWLRRCVRSAPPLRATRASPTSSS